MPSPFADDVDELGTKAKQVTVHVSYSVVKLFSEQLYASPLKAIEELVVNSWDADAEQCSVHVALDGSESLIAVFDNGAGMSLLELENLWHIGVSKKQTLAQPKRKQIGKFGIGKLASYAVARRVTYLSRSKGGPVHAISINFEAFAAASDEEGGASPVSLVLKEIGDMQKLQSRNAFRAASEVIRPLNLELSSTKSWTLVVLEDLKDQARELATGRLRWVLETAMPLESDFSLFLNGEPIQSAKARIERAIEFSLNEIPDERLSDLQDVTGEEWSRVPGGLKSKSFPQGILGEACVTHKSLYAEGGKSEDLGRSHGFFVRVHKRLLNEADPLFGARPLSFSTWYRFAAVVEVADLNRYITAARDDVEHSALKTKLREVLIQVFNEARDRHEDMVRKADEENRRRKEGTRDYVSTDLIERPLADVLVATAASEPDQAQTGGSAHSWRFLEVISDISELRELVDHLYSSDRQGRRYSFRYSPSGPLAPLARLDASSRTFYINEDHQLVREFSDKPESRRLLEAVVVGEVLLEVYLRAADVQQEIVSELLDRRDILLRSLALDESYSLKALAQALRGAQGSTELEVAVVGALRALGFGARHIGGSGTPDGVASYMIHGIEERNFTLEAKSSDDTPSLSHLDFAGLQAHYVDAGAQGCLLVAPNYPGASDPSSQVAKRAVSQRVSCWTLEDLARVVEAAERKRINARRIQDVVLTRFAPTDVSEAVEELLSAERFDRSDLYLAVLEALGTLEPRLKNTPRNVKMVATEVSRDDPFRSVEVKDVEDSLQDLARLSSGMLHITEDRDIYVLGALDELRRRVAHLTNDGASPRRLGTFRAAPSSGPAAGTD